MKRLAIAGVSTLAAGIAGYLAASLIGSSSQSATAIALAAAASMAFTTYNGTAK